MSARTSATSARRHEQPAYRLGQAQRIGEQPGGVLVGCTVRAALQVTDRPQAQPAACASSLLRQPSLGPQLPQQSSKRDPGCPATVPFALPARYHPGQDVEKTRTKAYADPRSLTIPQPRPGGCWTSRRHDPSAKRPAWERCDSHHLDRLAAVYAHIAWPVARGQGLSPVPTVESAAD